MLYNSIPLRSCISATRIYVSYNPFQDHQMGFVLSLLKCQFILSRNREYSHFEEQQHVGRHNSRQNHCPDLTLKSS